MKIGVLTFHNVPNYGAALQAYATSAFLKSRGNIVSIIDYQGNGNDKNFSIEETKKRYYEGHGIKKIINPLRYKLFVEKSYKVKSERFKEFRKVHFKLTAYEKDKLSKYDVIFYGSDQIWNPKITNGFDETLFACNSKNKNISYAASVGSIENIDQKESFFKLIKNFNRISVRENNLKKYIENSSHYKCDLVVDPVFLLEKEDYIELLEREKNNIDLMIKEKYLLIYQLQKYPETKKVAKQIAKKKNLKVIELNGCSDGWYSGKNSYNDCGPLEFLYMMLNAEYVVTNSFHGTAFSIIFKKDFNVIESRSGRDRIASLLDICNLTSRLVIENKGLLDYKRINYNYGLEGLYKLRTESVEFIENAFKKNE